MAVPRELKILTRPVPETNRRQAKVGTAPRTGVWAALDAGVELNLAHKAVRPLKAKLRKRFWTVPELVPLTWADWVRANRSRSVRTSYYCRLLARHLEEIRPYLNDLDARAGRPEGARSALLVGRAGQPRAGGFDARLVGGGLHANSRAS
jgi:hypothetical protein